MLDASAPPRASDAQIDPSDEHAPRARARRLDAAPEEVRDGLRMPGGPAADVELHLKGTRSASNREPVRQRP